MLVWSLIFALLYAIILGLASFMPLSEKIAPRAWSLPLLLALALAAVFFTPGELAVRALAAWIVPLIIKIDLDQLPMILAVIWLLGAGRGLIRLAWEGIKLKKILGALHPAADDPALKEALEALNFRRPVAIKQSGSGLPVTSWGIFRAVIIVPMDFVERYDHRGRLGIYLHELTHLNNRDSLKYIFMSALKHLMWFNPLVARSVERYRCHLEIVCDQQVVKLGLVGHSEYAKLITKHAGKPSWLLNGFSGDYQSIIRRFSYILKDATLRPVKRDRLAAGGGLVAALILGLSANLQPTSDELWAEFEKTTQIYQARPEKVEVIFFWQGALGTYSVVASK